MNTSLISNINYHLLTDERPSLYIKNILCEIQNSNLKIISDLEKINQSPIHHPEGNVLNHILLVIDAASLVRSFASNKQALMWSAFFHDLGKKKATKIKKGRITAYNHDTYGKEEAEKILSSTNFFTETTKQEIINLVYYHMHSLYISKNLPFGDLDNMLKSVNLNDMLLLFFADRLGRNTFSKASIEHTIDEIDVILNIISKTYNIQENIVFWNTVKQKLIQSFY